MVNFGIQEFGESWAEVVTAVATIGLFLATAALAWAAIKGGSIAIEQLKSLERTERIKNTLSIVRAYSTPTGEVSSPLMAYVRLDKMPTDDPSVAVPKFGKTLGEYVAEVSQLYLILQNYFDEADDLLQRNLIDRDLFLSRQLAVMKQSAAMMRRYQAFVPPQYLNEGLIARWKQRLPNMDGLTRRASCRNL